jgi:dienelactone hydrolase
MSILVILLALQDARLEDRLRDLDTRVMTGDSSRMIARDAEDRIRQANRRESDAWASLRSLADWERYRDEKIRLLRDSLGAPETSPRDLRLHVTKTLSGKGHHVENVVFESRPGLLVTGNLYVPEPLRPSMPGMLLVHSHHNPKTQSELQEMGILWAREGCLVLVLDQLGHGERRQHPFVDASSYPGAYRISRQDYFFRYMTSLQLYLAGESLLGWMVWDLQRGIDLLLARPGIDRNRILLLGAVAGGGDPAAVAAALDPRITVVAPFNFGGPQPETAYPLPAEIEASFNYAGGGSWESTRNLRLSARDGFLPWVIVGSVAPRRLVYGHEFSWDRDRDPVWKRLERIYEWTGHPEGLSFATGRGTLKGQPPEASHCNNIGPEQRKGIIASLNRWFGWPDPSGEPVERRSAADLECLGPGVRPRLVCEILRDRVGTFRRDAWDRILGGTLPGSPRATAVEPIHLGTIVVERFLLEVEPRITVPLLLLRPPLPGNQPPPVVVAVSQGGKQPFLKFRSAELAELLQGGVAICLPDLRGTGETRPGTGRGRASEATDIAATELMNGRTMVGLRLRDLRSVLRFLEDHQEVDGRRVALWGDSFADPNPPARRFDVPLELDEAPKLAEPMGGLVALLGALYEEHVRAVHVRGGLASFGSVLESPFVYVPLDVIVPGALPAGDLGGVISALGPRPVRQEGLVDGLNRRVSEAPLEGPGWLIRVLQER